MTDAQQWGKKFRGRNSGSAIPLSIQQQIKSQAAFFQYRLNNDQCKALNYEANHRSTDYVSTAAFTDGSWLLFTLYDDAYIQTTARQANKKQIALLEHWYGMFFDPFLYVSSKEMPEDSDRAAAIETVRQSRQRAGGLDYNTTL